MYNRLRQLWYEWTDLEAERYSNNDKQWCSKFNCKNDKQWHSKYTYKNDKQWRSKYNYNKFGSTKDSGGVCEEEMGNHARSLGIHVNIDRLKDLSPNGKPEKEGQDVRIFIAMQSPYILDFKQELYYDLTLLVTPCIIGLTRANK
jgi:hypothetical protein